jgi:DNA repair protein RadC
VYTPIYRVELVRERSHHVSNRIIEQPEIASEIVRRFLDGADRETFVVLGLTAKNRLIGICAVSVGSLSSTIVHPREVFKPAILMNACQIMVAHNHPSGDPTPSPEDKLVTRRLVDTGLILGIEVVDHLIVGDRGRSHSMRRDSPSWIGLTRSGGKEEYACIHCP